MRKSDLATPCAPPPPLVTLQRVAIVAILSVFVGVGLPGCVAYLDGTLLPEGIQHRLPEKARAELDAFRESRDRRIEALKVVESRLLAAASDFDEETLQLIRLHEHLTATSAEVGPVILN